MQKQKIFGSVFHVFSKTEAKVETGRIVLFILESLFREINTVGPDDKKTSQHHTPTSVYTSPYSLAVFVHFILSSLLWFGKFSVHLKIFKAGGEMGSEGTALHRRAAATQISSFFYSRVELYAEIVHAAHEEYKGDKSHWEKDKA